MRARPRAVVRAGLVALLALAAPAGAAKILVTTSADTVAADGGCSLREAIAAANSDLPVEECPAGSGPDRIEFALPLPATIALTAPLPALTSTVLLQGPGSSDLAISGQGTWPLLVFTGLPPAWLEVRDLTLADGNAGFQHGGGAQIGASTVATFRRVIFLGNRANRGGGLWTGPLSDVLVEACWFADNAALLDGGGGLWADGIASPGRLSVDRSAFTANRADDVQGRGGAIRSRTATTISRSTFSGNLANDQGGAVYLEGVNAVPPTSATVRHSTFANNTSDADGSGSGRGGGLSADTLLGAALALTLNNNILAGNAHGGGGSSPDLELGPGVTVTTLGHNLIGDNSGGIDGEFPTGQPNTNGDYVGSPFAPLDPRLEGLQFLGGSTPTRRPTLSPLSPALDNGKCPSSSSDQRGYGDRTAFTRAVDLAAVANGPDSAAGCDIGAFERGGDEGSDPAFFADGFESGTGFAWSHEQP